MFSFDHFDATRSACALTHSPSQFMHRNLQFLPRVGHQCFIPQHCLVLRRDVLSVKRKHSGFLLQHTLRALRHLPDRLLRKLPCSIADFRDASACRLKATGSGQLTNAAAAMRHDLHFHLHGFHHRNRIAFLDFGAFLDLPRM